MGLPPLLLDAVSSCLFVHSVALPSIAASISFCPQSPKWEMLAAAGEEEEDEEEAAMEGRVDKATVNKKKQQLI